MRSLTDQLTRLPRFTRRSWLGSTLGVGLSAAVSPWFESLVAAADTQPRRSVIFLWLNGGPATIDLWDLKPHHDHGGPFREIATATPGLKISEHLPQVAQWTEQMAMIRSMSTREGDHGRAAHLARTGYLPEATIDFPDLGPLLAEESHPPASGLPRCVSLAPASRLISNGAGYLGPSAMPLIVGPRAEGPADLVPPYFSAPPDLTTARLARRQQLLREVNGTFLRRHNDQVSQGLHATSEAAMRLMQPDVRGAFSLEDESAATRERYGNGLFGQGCLLARRLVERGVAFVELTLDGWDTHQDNFARVAALSTRLDSALAGLFADLQDRGLLDSTLIVCLGEFGRTPRINANRGRDHWPRAWSAVLAGGGVRGGAVIGRTTPDGTEVEAEPVTVADLITTICLAVGVDPRKQNISNVGRPIRVADPDGTVIPGVLN